MLRFPLESFVLHVTGNFIFGSTPLLFLSLSYIALILSGGNQCSPYPPHEIVLKTEFDLFSIFSTHVSFGTFSVSLVNSESNF